MTIRILLASCGAAAIMVASAPMTFAQESARPYRGLFASDLTAWTQSLSVSASASIGYDTYALSQDPDGLPAPGVPSLARSDARIYSLFTGGLSYAFNTERLQLGASTQSALRHYPGLSEFVPVVHGAGAGAALNIGRGTRVGVTGSVSAQPAMLFQPFASTIDQPLGQIGAPDYDFANATRRYTSYGTSAQVTQTLWRSASIGASYGRQTARFAWRDSEYQYHAGAARITQGIARGIALRVGYGLAEGRYGDDSPLYREQQIDAGIDYNRPVSLSRRTRLSVATGSAALSDGHDRRFAITGSARLTQDIGRTWQATLNYGRDVAFYESLRAPFFYDSVGAAINGLFARRVAFQSSAGALLGDLAKTAGEPGTTDFDTWHAGSSLSIALTRHLAIGADYVFYRSWFTAPMLIGEEVAPTFNRHTVRLSLRAWAPLIQRGRRDDASR